MAIFLLFLGLISFVVSLWLSFAKGYYGKSWWVIPFTFGTCWTGIALILRGDFLFSALWFSFGLMIVVIEIINVVKKRRIAKKIEEIKRNLK
jgi:hypothetical protein